MKLYVFLLIVVLSCKQSVQQETKVISPNEVQTYLQKGDIQLVDVRTPEEYKDGFIAKAINIDFFSPTFLEEISKLDKEKPIILYCKKGGRSAKSAKQLHDAGFIEIYDLEGGFTNWKDKGLDVMIPDTK